MSSGYSNEKGKTAETSGEASAPVEQSADVRDLTTEQIVDEVTQQPRVPEPVAAEAHAAAGSGILQEPITPAVDTPAVDTPHQPSEDEAADLGRPGDPALDDLP